MCRCSSGTTIAHRFLKHIHYPHLSRVELLFSYGSIRMRLMKKLLSQLRAGGVFTLRVLVDAIFNDRMFNI